MSGFPIRKFYMSRNKYDGRIYIHQSVKHGRAFGELLRFTLPYLMTSEKLGFSLNENGSTDEGKFALDHRHIQKEKY